MEMGIAITALVLSLLALASEAAALVLVLMVVAPKEEESGQSRTPTPTAPPKDGKNSGEWSEATFSRGGKQSRDTHDLRAAPDVERRRRKAVQAKEHSNFMDYDGAPQMPIDPNTILGE